MPIYTVVKGDPESIRAAWRWTTLAKTEVTEAGSSAYGTRTASAGPWLGGAGEGFRMVMSSLGGIADGLAAKITATGTGIMVFAGELQTVQTRIATARTAAVTGGLTVTATSILPPGAAPKPAGALPPNATPQQTTAHGNAVAAEAAYVAKIRAYRQAALAVENARAYEQAAQRKLGVGPLKDLASVTDLGVGAATGAAEASSTLRVNQASFDAKAAKWARWAKSSSATTRAHALWNLANNAIEAERYRVAAESNLVARFGASQPQWVKNMLGKPVVGGIPQPKPRVLRPATPVGAKPPTWLTNAKGGAKALGRVPLVGIGLAALGVGLEIASGTDPVKAVASGAAGVVGGVVGGAVGAATGAALCSWTGPGAVVGGVVGGVIGGMVVGQVASGAVEQAFG